MAYTTQNAPLPWVQPYLQDYMARAQEVANTPYQASPGTAVGPNQMQTTAWDAIANRAMQGSPVNAAAQNLATNTMNGGFLNNNPYLSDAISNAQGDLVKSWNMVQKPAWDTAMARSGSFGNSGIMEMNQAAQSDLQKNLGRIGTDMRLGAYNTERQMMQNAMGMAPTLANQDYYDANQLNLAGQQANAYNQEAANQNYRWWQEAQNFPQQQLDAYGSALGMGGRMAGTQTQTPDPSRLSTAAGGALVGSQLAPLFGMNGGNGAFWGGLLGLLGG